jgi:hypothetical protein
MEKGSLKPKVGRPAKRAVGVSATLTVRLPAGVKNWLVDQAAAFDMTLTEFLIMLVERNAR